MARLLSLLLALLAAARLPPTTALQLTLFPNAGFGGAPAFSNPLTDLSAVSLAPYLPASASTPFSLRVEGALSMPDAANPAIIRCSSNHTGPLFLFLGPHLVCASGIATFDTPTPFRPDARLLPLDLPSAERNNVLSLRLELAGGEAGAPEAASGKRESRSSEAPASTTFEMQWAPLLTDPFPMGCYVDNSTRDLPFDAHGSAVTNGPAECAERCRGFSYMGLQDGANCFCGDTYGRYGPAPADDCSMPCPGDPGAECGNAWRNSIYALAPEFEPIPSSAFAAPQPAPDAWRLDLQRSLLNNTWGTYARYSVSAHARVPEGAVLRFGVCNIATQACMLDVSPHDIAGTHVRLGAHAYDHSYTQLYMRFESCNVSLETSQTVDGELLVLVTPVNCSAGYAAAVAAEFADRDTRSGGAYWRRPGTITTANGTNGSSHIVLTPAGHGMQTVTLYSSEVPTVLGNNTLWMPFNGSARAWSTGRERHVDNVGAAIAEARKAEEATYAAYGKLGPVKQVSQIAMMWNEMFSPEQAGPFFPVSRSFFAVWPIFDWDNIFGAYQLSLDHRELAYSQLISVLGTKTARGFIPNYFDGQGVSYDRTEPVIGAKVLAAMFEKYGDYELVDLLYDDLYDWLDFMWTSRREPPLNLICLGSDVNILYPDSSANAMQGARYESGLDNSPMYDAPDSLFNKTSNHMMLYDVGMSSLVAMELGILANLSLNGLSNPRPQDHTLLMQRYTELTSLIQTHLWSPADNAFVNAYSANGSFYARVSPTSFYPLLAGAASDTQADAIVSSWLMNNTRFCIAPDGDMANNTDSCYWGLPSINAADPAFPPLGYWRGYVWGPTAQLVYWSLEQYAHLPIVAQAKAALARQMTALEQHIWQLTGHVCENFNPHRNGTDCTGNTFYHWGALTGFISLLEGGFY